MKYRKIETRIWCDQKFRLLNDDEKLFFLFILSHPTMTSIGAMRCTAEGLAAELEWTPKKANSALSRLSELQMVEFDRVAGYIGLPNFIKFNKPENPNVVKSWGAALDMIPECDFLQQQMLRAATSLLDYSEKFVEALPEPFRKGLPNSFERVSQSQLEKTGTGFRKQEQEQEPEQEQNPSPPNPPLGGIPEEWKEVENGLKNFGVSASGTAIRNAISIGFSPGNVKAMLEFCCDPKRAGDIGPGAIYGRMTNRDAIRWKIDENWPPPDPKAKGKRKSDDAIEAAHKVHLAGEAKKRELKEHDAFLEQRFGEMLNGMALDKMMDLLAGQELLQKRLFQNKTPDGLVRPALLKALAKRHESEHCAVA